MRSYQAHGVPGCVRARFARARGKACTHLCAQSAPLQLPRCKRGNWRLRTRLGSAPNGTHCSNGGIVSFDQELWSGTEAEVMNLGDFRQLPPLQKVMLLSDGSVTRHLQLLYQTEVHVERLEEAHHDTLDLSNAPPTTSYLEAPYVRRQVLLRAGLDDTGPRSQPPGTRSRQPVSSRQAANRAGNPERASSCSDGSAPVGDVQACRDDTHTRGSSEASYGASQAAGAPALVYAVSWWSQAAYMCGDTSKPIWENLSGNRMELFRDIQRVWLGYSTQLDGLLESRGPYWGREYIFWNNGRVLTVIREVFSSALGQSNL